MDVPLLFAMHTRLVISAEPTRSLLPRCCCAAVGSGYARPRLRVERCGRVWPGVRRHSEGVRGVVQGGSGGPVPVRARGVPQGMRRVHVHAVRKKITKQESHDIKQWFCNVVTKYWSIYTEVCFCFVFLHFILYSMTVLGSVDLDILFLFFTRSRSFVGHKNAFRQSDNRGWLFREWRRSCFFRHVYRRVICVFSNA